MILYAVLGAFLSIVASGHGSEEVLVREDAVASSTWSCLRHEGLHGRDDGMSALYPTRDQLDRCSVLHV